MKKWYTSKTLWVNALGIIAIALQGQYGFILSPELQVGALGFINVILRLITKSEITWA